jgi:hypothetical protein
VQAGVTLAEASEEDDGIISVLRSFGAALPASAADQGSDEDNAGSD